MMTKEPWDWSFASFAEQPALDDDDPLGDDTLGDDDGSDEEPTSPCLFRGKLAGNDELDRHLWRLRSARNPEERRVAATAALRFLEETRSAARRARRRAVEEEPTLVDQRVPPHLAHPPVFELSSSGDASLS